MAELILADNHEQVYSVWKERGMRGLKVAHVDFHCDMRSILIDRPRGRAFFTSHRESTFIDRGNFLGHAIMNGIVTDVQWIHGPHGGRLHDDGPVVRYESDFLAPWYRFKHDQAERKEASLTYRESLLSDWSGLRPGEQLDLDWDGLASVDYDPAHRNTLIEQFLSKDFGEGSDLSFLIYSPGYSDPDRSLYEAFAERLSEKLNAQIVRLPRQALNRQGERFGALRRMVPSHVKTLKRHVAKNLRQFDAAHDLDFYAGQVGASRTAPVRQRFRRSFRWSGTY